MEYFWAFLKAFLFIILVFIGSCVAILFTSFGLPVIADFLWNYREAIGNIVFLLLVAVMFVSNFLHNLDLERKKKSLEAKNNS